MLAPDLKEVSLPKQTRYRSVRGTEDILPDSQPRWRSVRDVMVSVCERYSYGQIDTPIFEDYNLFVRGVGEVTDIVEKEMYLIPDRSGGDTLALRPEATAAVCRAYLQHGLHSRPQPVRLYTVMAPMFRYSRPQSGRLRQFHQLNVEAIGDTDATVDAEILGLCWQVFTELGLKGLTLQLNSIGDPVCRPGYVKELRAYYGDRAGDLCRDCTARLDRAPLRLLDCKEDRCQPFIEDAPRSRDHLCPDCESHFADLVGFLESMGVPFDLDHRLVRGLDYYTRTVFEVQTSEEGGQNALGGGGRYDGLIEEIGGRPTPGVGFAMGIERIILNLERQAVEAPAPATPMVFVAYVGHKARERAVVLSAELVREGVSNMLGPASKSLKAQLRQAGNMRAPFVAIIGDDEAERGVVTLRNMSEGTQVEASVGELAGLLPRMEPREV